MLKEKFFDREAYLDILKKRIGDFRDGYHQNLAIIGDELVGKTSTIFKFLDQFCDNRIVIIYLETRPESLESFGRRFIGVLLYNFLINCNIPLKEDLDYLLAKSEKFIPQTARKIKLILNAIKRRKKNHVFTEILSICDIFNQETDKSCVVILDEFHNLEKLGIKDSYQEWAKLLITQKNTMFVIISSMKYKTRSILSKELSLLFGNFQLITVEPFDIKTSERYIAYKLKDLNLDSGLRNFIVDFTAGFPLYLDVICETLLKQNQGSLADVLEGLLFDASGILNQRFSNYIKRFLDYPNSNDYLSILYLISSGSNKIKDITHILHRQKKEINLRVSHLLELDTIIRNGDFLKINDRVFSFWLKFVHQQKLNSLTFDAKCQKEIFKSKIEQEIQNFLADAKRPVMERMFDLLNQFDNDRIQMERKRLRLNHFREIKPIEFNDSNLKNGILGRSQDSIWIIAIKNDLLTEDDITSFVKECKKFHHKLQRRIIVTLRDIETNTRLRALEEKVWAWDINILNQILELFSKPRVIV